MKKMEIGEFIQQGDVIVERVEKIQGQKIQGMTVAYGKATGHHHTFIDDVELYEKEGVLFCKVLTDEAILKHQEHGIVAVPIGDYVVRKVREYDHFLEESREVMD